MEVRGVGKKDQDPHKARKYETTEHLLRQLVLGGGYTPFIALLSGALPPEQNGNSIPTPMCIS